MIPASIDKGRGRVALLVGHCAGMVDLIGLPLWVGILIEWYRFDPQQAGGLATLFLAGIVVASALLAPRFDRLPGRRVAALGFLISAAGFFVASTTRDTLLLTVLHAVCGLATGAGLSITHGTISQGRQPHRLMALAGVALGVFAIVFMALVPGILNARGGPALFTVFGAVMAIAAITTLTSFPARDGAAGASTAPGSAAEQMPSAVWFGLIGFTCIGLGHSMTMSFLERVGVDHGFSREQIQGALLTMAIVAIFPGAIAAWLEHRLRVRAVLFIAPILHTLMVNVLMNTATFPAYVVAMALLPGLMIFMHTFVFGVLAKLDRSGRSLAAFPAAIMVGSALGPVAGGTIVKSFGYGALGATALALAIAVVLCFLRLTKEEAGAAPAAASAL